ncbi:hypothetical protein ACFVU2_06085 [Leifsonia sp. NPDC058194]|uniref:hypothetical protein n=1 Tax=Leifsonia sp. NPDC058194 TaxID=3346374 RepID=UPI0036DBECA7
MDTIIAVYGAVLATAIAVAQGVNALRRRVRVGVSASLHYSQLNASDREASHGTPIRVKRDHDSHWEEVLLHLSVRNEGGVPVQIVAVVIESLKRNGDLAISQFSPEPLPHVLDPGTRIEITMQKEPIDMLDNLTFLGVLDALGRRYSPKPIEIRNVVGQSWSMPTRVREYVRRDDATAHVLAYQNRERSALIETTRRGKKATAIISRPSVLTNGSGDGHA